MPERRPYRPVLDRPGLTHAAPYDDEDARLERGIHHGRAGPAHGPPVDLRARRRRALGAGARAPEQRPLRDELRRRDGRGRPGRPPVRRQRPRPPPGGRRRRSAPCTGSATARPGTSAPGRSCASSRQAWTSRASPTRCRQRAGWTRSPSTRCGSTPRRRSAPSGVRSRRPTTPPSLSATRRSRGRPPTRRWTGSWYTVFVTVDRLGGGEIDAAFERRAAGVSRPLPAGG